MWCKSFYFETPTYPRPEFSDPKILKMCDPSLVTLTKMQPHNSQSSRENLGAHPHYNNTTDPSPLPPPKVYFEQSTENWDDSCGSVC